MLCNSLRSSSAQVFHNLVLVRNLCQSFSSGPRGSATMSAGRLEDPTDVVFSSGVVINADKLRKAVARLAQAVDVLLAELTFGAAMPDFVAVAARSEQRSNRSIGFGAISPATDLVASVLASPSCSTFAKHPILDVMLTWRTCAIAFEQKVVSSTRTAASTNTLPNCTSRAPSSTSVRS